MEWVKKSQVKPFIFFTLITNKTIFTSLLERLSAKTRVMI
jgi:hypothetical protein